MHGAHSLTHRKSKEIEYVFEHGLFQCVRVCTLVCGYLSAVSGGAKHRYASVPNTSSQTPSLPACLSCGSIDHRRVEYTFAARLRPV